MTTRFFRKTNENLLAPLHDEDMDWLRKQPMGKQFKANMKSTRNLGHHRKAFALFKLVLDNHPAYTNIEEVLLEFKLQAGHYIEHIRPGNGQTAVQLRLMSALMPHPDSKQRMLKFIEELEQQARLVYVPKSISFDEMGQEEFEELYEKWIAIGCAMIGVEDNELRAELAGF